MMKLPEKFTAVDPVSGLVFVVDRNRHTAFPSHSMYNDKTKGFANISDQRVRALIEYGRQMERDEEPVAVSVNANQLNIIPECIDCAGVGEVDIERGGIWIECSTCGGTGYANTR